MIDRHAQLLARLDAVERAERDLVAFAQLMNPDPMDPDNARKSAYQAAAHHYLIADKLTQVEQGRIKRLIITCPPRHGKTALASHLFSAWYAGRNPGKHLILATYNERFAWDHGSKVRDIMQSPAFAQVFPNTGLKRKNQSTARLEVSAGGVLAFVGRGGTITGRGGHVLTLDDPIKDRKEADSPAVRDHLWTWYNQVLKSRLMTKAGAIIIIMTRWHEDDLVGRLTDKTNPHYSPKERKHWDIVDLPALAEKDDPLDRNLGAALWPDRFDEKFLRDFQRADARGFEALYQGRPTPAKGAFFQRDHIKTYKSPRELPPMETLRVYAASDHAVSMAQDRDRTCLLLAAVDPSDDIWILPQTYWGQIPSNRAVELMVDMMELHRPIFWWGEKGQIAGSIGPFLRKRMFERGVHCAIVEEKPSADKVTRAQSIMARMAMGKVYFPAFASWYAPVEAELLKFPSGAHDDFVDALAWLGLGLQSLQPRAREIDKAKTPETRTLGWLKAGTQAREQAARARRARQGW